MTIDLNDIMLNRELRSTLTLSILSSIRQRGLSVEAAAVRWQGIGGFSLRASIVA